MPYDSTKSVISAHADEAAEIPAGRYEVRAGSPGFALATNVSYTAGAVPPETPADRVRLRLVPGGSLSITGAAVPSPGAVQIVSLSTGKTDVLLVDREREVPVPSGKLVAVGLISPGKFLGITTILQIRQGQKTVVGSFAKPAPGRSNVLVRGDYAKASPPDPKDVAIALSSGAARVESDASVNALDGSHYSVFYGIPQGPKRIDVTSKRWRINSADVTVSEPFVWKGDLVLLLKPALTVRPKADALSEKWKVTVYSCKAAEFGPGSPAWPALETCVSDPVVEGSGSEVVVHDLDAKWYFVVVELGANKAGKQVDLRSGEDREEDFNFQRRRVYGVVREGDQGVAATLTFKNLDTGNLADDVTSGSDGSYEQFLSAAGKYRVEVRTQGTKEAPPAVFQLVVGEEESTHQDFTIPGGRVTVTVSNERTREPIRDANVVFTVSGANEERKTDESGVATLPPLPPGTLRLAVEADGYQRKSQSFQVLAAKTTQRWSVFLKPMDAGQAFRVVLPDGSPAASATVLWSLDPGGFQFRQRCDGNGTCRFVQRPSDEENLFIVHKQGGLTVVSAGTAFGGQQVQLLPMGGRLTVNVRRGSAWQGAALSAKVVVAGTVVGPIALEAIATLAGESSQLYLSPGRAQPIVIAGLPAGTPLGVVVSPAAIGFAQTQDLRPTPVQLPLAGALEVVLP